MPRRVALALGMVLTMAAVGCGTDMAAESSETSTQATETSTQAVESDDSYESFDRSNWDILASDPDAHKGANVDFVGRVFSVERDKDGVYLQVWQDPENSENNTIVGYEDSGFRVAEDDYVRVTGTVKGAYKGENAFGAELTVPAIVADTLRVVPATAAAPPALSTYGKATYTQEGITVTIRKVEFAESETRVFVTVHNASGYNASVYDSSMKAVQRGRQYDPTFSTADYPEISTDLLAGASTSGVVVFPKMNPNANLKLVVEVNSDDTSAGDYGTLTYIFTWR